MGDILADKYGLQVGVKAGEQPQQAIAANDVLSQKYGLQVGVKANAVDNSTAKEPAANGENNSALYNASQGFMHGLAAAPVGAAQFFWHAMPESVQKGAENIGLLPGGVAALDKGITTADQVYDRDVAGSKVAHVANFAGTALSYAPLALAAPEAGASMGANALFGAGTGAVAGLATPVTNVNGDYASQKAGQVAGGAIAGGVIGAAAPKVISAVGNGSYKLASGIKSAVAADDVAQLSQQAADQTLQHFGEVQKELGAKGIDLSKVNPDILSGVKQDIAKALAENKTVDPAAMIRKAEFDSLGIQPTLGQITRDPLQWAKEQNLKGVEGGGDQLAQRFEGQSNQLLEHINRIGAAGAKERDVASNEITNALQSIDAPKRQAISDAYNRALNAPGATVELNAAPLAQAYGNVLETYGKEVIPSAIQNKLESLGIGGAKQTARFNPVEAEKTIQAINDNYDPMQPRMNKALKQIRDGIQDSLTAAPKFGKGTPSEAIDAFNTARKMAAERFASHRNVAGLEDVINGKIDDNFVSKNILSPTATAKSVNALAEYMKDSPDAFNLVKSQIAEELRKAAFGQNTAGDSAFAQASYNKMLDKIGTNKLKAFFDDETVDQLKNIGKVGAYITSKPGAAMANSGTAAHAANLLSYLAGKVSGVPLLESIPASAQRAAQSREVQNALAAKIEPVLVNPLQPKLDQLSRIGAVTAAAESARQR